MLVPSLPTLLTLAVLAIWESTVRAAPKPSMSSESELVSLLGINLTDVVKPGSIQTLSRLEIGHIAADPEVKKVKTTYGPFVVPPVTVNGGMKSYLQIDGVPKPCSNCTIIVARPDLQFEDGSYANANTSMWLHHIQIFNLGRQDITCPQFPERMIASGNERTVHAYTVPGQKKAGVYLGNEPIGFLAELMNSAKESRNAVITWEWDYVEGKPAEYARLQPLWLDVTGVCGYADVKVPTDKSTFTLKQEPLWKSTISGEIITLGGHIHDGGMRTRIMKNGQVVCDSVAGYGETPAFVEPMGNASTGGHSHGIESMGRAHLSSMKVCNWSGLGTTSIGDEWGVEATYNLTQYAPMMQDGEPVDVMGNAMVYISESTRSGG